MPTYEYQCDGCGKVFEATQRITEDPLKKHAECGSKKVKRLISQTSFQLKGSGWYVTDYAGKKSSDDKSTENKSGDKAGETKGNDKSDSAKTEKAETKAETKSEPKTEKKTEKKKDSGKAA